MPTRNAPLTHADDGAADAAYASCATAAAADADADAYSAAYTNAYAAYADYAAYIADADAADAAVTQQFYTRWWARCRARLAISDIATIKGLT